MKKQDLQLDLDLPARLALVGAKLLGLGHLIGHQTRNSDSEDDTGSYGIGEILKELGREIEEIQERIETS